MIENLQRYTMVIRRDEKGYATPALKRRKKGDIIKFSELEEAVERSDNNDSQQLCRSCKKVFLCYLSCSTQSECDSYEEYSPQQQAVS